MRARRIRSLPACAELRTKRRRKYVVAFYPHWFGYYQVRLAYIADGNQMTWPDRMTPIFGCVVAPNDDTLYAAGFFDLSQEPAILTIPPIDVSYSVPAVDAYRASFSNVNVHDAGTYALTGPGWPQDLTPDITLIHVPDISPVWMFRVGRFSNGTDRTAAAEQTCRYRRRRRTVPGRSGLSRPGACHPGRRAAEWAQENYAGSLAEDVWRRLEALDVINRGMVFAATLLLCFFPFLIVVSALAGRPVADSLARFTGLNGQAAADVGHLFASSAATASAVVGTASMVFFVFGGIAAAAALQEIYERAFELPRRRMKDIPRRLAWLAVLIGTSLLTGWAAPGLRQAGGPVLLAAAGLAWATGFWWLTMAILLAGRTSWRALFPAACATGVLYVAMI